MGKRVLIIAQDFPPCPGVGSLRYRGLAKYLPGFGWEPVVLTEYLPGETYRGCPVVRMQYPGNPLRRLVQVWSVGRKYPPAHNAAVPGGCRDTGLNPNTIAGHLRRLLLPPSRYRGLSRYLIRAAREIMHRTPVDAIISGSVIDHVVAAQLKRESGIPWIADLRDLWTQNHNYMADPLTRWLETLSETRTFSRVDALVTVSNPLAKKLASFHGGKPVYVIPNGFDIDEFVDVPRTKAFTITYAGHIYRGKQSPEPLFHALNALFSREQLDRDCVRVRFFSAAKQWLEAEVHSHGLTDIVECHCVVSRTVVLQKERESQLLLLLNWNDPQERGVYTGKVFEYLLMRRPVLAVGGSRSVVTELMEMTRAGVHTATSAEIARVLMHYYHGYLAHGEVPFEGDDERIALYSHGSMARRFATVLEVSTMPRGQNDSHLHQNHTQGGGVIDLVDVP
jgi:glycosyltransferase involved in cell wall biosynthesis